MRIRKTLPTIVCAFMMACTIGMPAAYADDTAPTDEPTPADVQVIDTPEQSVEGGELKKLPDLRAAATPTEGITVNPSLDRDEASISKLSIDQITDGTAPWDKDDQRGNDSSPSNMTVRSFDKVTYNVRFVATSDDSMTYWQNAYVGFKVTLPYDRQQASFDLGSIAWAEYDEAHKPTVTTNTDGSQTLTCWRKLTPTSTSPYAIPGTYTVPFAVNVKAMTSGQTLTPTFEAWTAPNDTHHRTATLTPDPVRISSYPRFDVTVGQSGGGVQVTNGAATWPFASSDGRGKYTSDDMHTDLGSRKGLLTDLMLSVNMANKDTGKGLRGLELPDPNKPLRYTVEVRNRFTSTGGTAYPADARTQTYFYAAHGQTRSAGYYQNPNRDLINQWTIRDDYGYYPRPSGSGSGTTTNSGNVEVKETRLTDHSVYEITVHDWSVDVDKLPTRNSGNRYECGTALSTANCTVTTGVIAVASLRLFSPTTIDGEDAAKHYGASLTLRQDMSAAGIDVTSVTGVNVLEQVRTDNDRANVGQLLEPPGSVRMFTYYACSANAGMLWANGTDCAGWVSQDWTKGTDATLRGNMQRIQPITQYSKTASLGAQGVLPMNLIKIDDKVISVPDQTAGGAQDGTGGYKGWWRVRDGYTQSIDVDPDIYYAVKKDGTGWKDDDEQKKALIDDLDYYKDHAQAEQHGVIVGILIASRTVSTMSRNDIWTPPSIQVKVKDDAPVGYVAQITQHAQMWTRQDLIDHGVDIDVDDTAAWKQWAQNTDPLRYRTTITPTYDDRSWNGRDKDYAKTSYTADGAYVPGTEGNHYGDSLTIIGEKARISVTTDQAKPNTDPAKGGKDIYDIDKEQRIIDWRVSGYANTPTPNTDGRTTDWRITVTIPKGLKYVEGSSVFEGSYTEQTPSQGHIEGGTELTPDSMRANGDGSTTIVYTLHDMPIRQQFRPIHLSTTIGDAFDTAHDVRNGDQFTLTATITTTGDMALPSTGNSKQASYTVQAVRTKASSLATRADPLMNETNGDTDFMDMSVNAATQDKNKALTIGQLPRNGVNGSSFQGAYNVHGFDLTATGVDTEDNIEFYVTDDPRYAGIDPLTLTIDAIRAGFTKATAKTTGANTLRVNAGPSVTAFAMLVHTMKPNGRIDVRVDATANGNKAGDVYVNRYSDTDNVVTAISAVVSRSLDGKVWEDSNKNGARDDGERMVANVRVELIRRNDGKTIASTVTGDDGAYRFDRLPAGDFNVRFTAPDDADWNLFAATTTKADGVDGTVNSDASSVDNRDLKDGAIISSITMPALKDMTSSRYTAHDEDLGIVRIAHPKHTMPLTGDGRWLFLLLAVSVLTAGAGIVLVVRGGKH